MEFLNGSTVFSPQQTTYSSNVSFANSFDQMYHPSNYSCLPNEEYDDGVGIIPKNNMLPSIYQLGELGDLPSQGLGMKFPEHPEPMNVDPYIPPSPPLINFFTSGTDSPTFDENESTSPVGVLEVATDISDDGTSSDSDSSNFKRGTTNTFVPFEVYLRRISFKRCTQQDVRSVKKYVPERGNACFGHLKKERYYILFRSDQFRIEKNSDSLDYENDSESRTITFPRIQLVKMTDTQVKEGYISETEINWEPLRRASRQRRKKTKKKKKPTRRRRRRSTRKTRRRNSNDDEYEEEEEESDDEEEYKRLVWVIGKVDIILKFVVPEQKVQEEEEEEEKPDRREFEIRMSVYQGLYPSKVRKCIAEPVDVEYQTNHGFNLLEFPFENKKEKEMVCLREIVSSSSSSSPSKVNMRKSSNNSTTTATRTILTRKEKLFNYDEDYKQEEEEEDLSVIRKKRKRSSSVDEERTANVDIGHDLTFDADYSRRRRRSKRRKIV